MYWEKGYQHSFPLSLYHLVMKVVPSFMRPQQKKWREHTDTQGSVALFSLPLLPSDFRTSWKSEYYPWEDVRQRCGTPRRVREVEESCRARERMPKGSRKCKGSWKSCNALSLSFSFLLSLHYFFPHFPSFFSRSPSENYNAFPSSSL